MICDYRTLDVSQDLEVDLCILGAGAAGIAMARHFADTGVRVALLESGGYKYDQQVQELYKGTNVGMKYFELDQCRTRRFGGSTWCWGGMCTPMTAIDFRERDWVPMSGWPFDEREMEPYFRRAHDLCGIGPYDYSAGVWRELGQEPLPFRPELLVSHFWQMNSRKGWRQVRFAKKFHADLRTPENVTVYLHANAVELVLAENGRQMSHVRTKTMDGREGKVFARMVVLACGGLENPRMLLASNRQRAAGLGNEHGLVGRYFHEHLEAALASVIPFSPKNRMFDYARWWEFGQSHARPGITLSPVAQEREAALNLSLSIDAVYDEQYVWRAAKEIWDDVVARRLTAGTAQNALRVARQSPKAGGDVYRRVRYGSRPMGVAKSYTMYARAEQSPNAESRVYLGTTRDRLGTPELVMDWRTNALDHRAFEVTADNLEVEIPRLGLGRVEVRPWVREGGWPAELKGGPHHMGTTRMADDPRLGVVDRDAKVHGVEGLYVAGSSIFPTGGHANCTMTLLATTLRLCDHLETVMARTGVAAELATA